MSAMPTKARQRYLELLGAQDTTRLRERILSEVRRALGSLSDAPPIRLSRIAHEFDIQPMPEYGRTSADGELSFNDATGRFVIELNARYEQRGQGKSERVNSPEDSTGVATLRRGRFTYAHEFMHRFLFVRDRGTWRRALAVVLDEASSVAERFLWLRTLSGDEERLVQGLAGDVLVPASVLVDAASTARRGAPEDDDIDLSSVLRQVQSRCEVSFECALVRCERALREGAMPSRSDFVMLFIDWTDVKGSPDHTSSGRSRGAFRIRVHVCPSELDGRRLKEWFPGMSIENLGEEFVDQVRSWCLEEAGPIRDRASSVVRLRFARSAERDDGTMGRIVGHRLRLAPAKKGGAGRVLVWGKLLPT